jgi:hypothetical protein
MKLARADAKDVSAGYWWIGGVELWFVPSRMS